jgi:YgiT-type zinc finger domain-containing protein
MNGKKNYCPFCHGGMMLPGVTTYTVELGFGVVVVRNVPALVCKQCGSDWIEDDIAEKLEVLVDSARSKHPVVEVANWEDMLTVVNA